MNDSEIILIYIQRNNSITKNQVKELLGVKDTKAKVVLNKLINNNKIIRKGTGKNTYYTLNK